MMLADCLSLRPLDSGPNGAFGDPRADDLDAGACCVAQFCRAGGGAGRVCYGILWPHGNMTVEKFHTAEVFIGVLRLITFTAR